MKILKLEHHRNGVSGCPFHVAIVKDEGREMLVIRFSKEAELDVGDVLCAAFDLAQLDKREIRFGLNSWRGEHFIAAMDRAIEERNAESDAGMEAAVARSLRVVSGEESK